MLGHLARAALAAAALAPPGAAAEADWRAIANPFDEARIDGADAAFRAAMEEALAGGAPRDVDALADAVRGGRREIDTGALLGDWRCRTILIGGGPALTVYGFFRCRVRRDGAHLVFEKLTGSQRTSGRLFPDGPTRMVYLGAAHVAGEDPRPYGGPDNRAGDHWRNPDDPGLLFVLGPDKALLGFPSPVVGGDYKLLELRR